MNRCPDCAVAPGKIHHGYCDVARCLVTGGQRFSCWGDHDCGHDTWTGEWPGYAEATEFGWFALLVSGQGWVSVPPGTPGAIPDLNRLVVEAHWSPEERRWIR
jgi:hypothetical protein